MPSGTLQSHCPLYRLFTDVFRLILYSHNCNVYVVILCKQLRCIESLIQNNFLRRFTQIRETGVWLRVRQEYRTSQEPEEEPSIIDVSMVTVAPILVILAAGYVIGIFVLLIERCVHGNILHFWPRWIDRRWQQKEFGRLLYNYHNLN
jgi:hypothetical protein